jgi:hypothetical protein
MDFVDHEKCFGEIVDRATKCIVDCEKIKIFVHLYELEDVDDFSA